MVDWKHNCGVTLVEILVVLGVIVVLTGLVVTVTLRVENQSQENALRSAFTLVANALREYYDFQGQFPVQPERIVWQAQATPQDYDAALAKVRGHMIAVITELRSVPVSRQVLDNVSDALMKTLTPMVSGSADVQSLSDPWGTVVDYIYVAPDDNVPELISAGPDRVFGTADDISSKSRR